MHPGIIPSVWRLVAKGVMVYGTLRENVMPHTDVTSIQFNVTSVTKHPTSLNNECICQEAQPIMTHFVIHQTTVRA